VDFISIRQVRNLRQGADPRDFKTLRSARHQPHEDAEGPATPAPRARVSGCEPVLSTPHFPPGKAPKTQERIGTQRSRGLAARRQHAAERTYRACPKPCKRPKSEAGSPAQTAIRSPADRLRERSPEVESFSAPDRAALPNIAPCRPITQRKRLVGEERQTACGPGNAETRQPPAAGPNLRGTSESYERRRMHQAGLPPRHPARPRSSVHRCRNTARDRKPRCNTEHGR